MNDDIDPRVAPYMRPELFQNAADARRQLGTADLVMVIADGDMNVFRRTDLLSEDLTPYLREKLSAPANSSSERFGQPDESFWLFLIEGDEAVATAVNASLIAPGGTA